MDAWFLLALGAAVVWASGNIVDKHVISKKVKSFFVLNFIWGIAALVFAVATALYSPIDFALSAGALYGLAAGVVCFFAWIFYVIAFRNLEVSRAISLYLTVPLFVTVIAFFFLGEKLSASKYAAIGLIVAGAFLISFKKSETSLFAAGSSHLVFSAMLYSVSDVLSKLSATEVGGFSAFFWFLAGLVVSVAVSSLFRFGELRAYVRKPVALRELLLSSLFSNIGRLFLLLSISLGPVSLAVALSSTQSFFVFVFATAISFFLPSILREDTGAGTLAAKGLAILLMFAGVYLLS